MKEYILITGATSGIGYEMARMLAHKKHNLILVARNEHKLQKMKLQLSEIHQVGVEIFAYDLSFVENAIELHSKIKVAQLSVMALINNAGTGLYGDFLTIPLVEELKMIELNVSSLVVLTKLFAQDMVKKGSGRIMNIASLLSFLPLPYYSVYAATKTFVLAFSETIAAELEGTGVTITALCPGPVDTNFTTEKMANTNAYSANKPMSAEKVAREAVNFLFHGKGKKLVGFNNWFISQLPRVTPSFIMIKIKKHLASQK